MAELAAGPAVSWWVARVSVYRFLIRDDEICGFCMSPQPTPVPHAPAWMVGLSGVQTGVVGVVDLGRFLGVCTAAPGVIVVPAAALDCGWALRVHDIEPGPAPGGVIERADPVETPPGALRRLRPSFVGDTLRWLDPQGRQQTADELSLRRWALHPRLQEKPA